MHFIEQWLGISPDGGNGTLEAALVIAAASLIVSLILRRRRSWASARAAEHEAALELSVVGNRERPL